MADDNLPSVVSRARAVHIVLVSQLLEQEVSEHAEAELAQMKRAILVCRDLDAAELERLSRSKVDLEEADRTVARHWRQVKKNVSNERAAWGVPAAERRKKVFVKLDGTQDRFHMRRKLRRSLQGTRHEEASAHRQSSHEKKEGEGVEQEVGLSLEIARKLAGSFFSWLH